MQSLATTTKYMKSVYSLSTSGLLLSTVTVFFKVLPCLIDCSRLSLAWAGLTFLLPPPNAGSPGGGGGGGPGRLAGGGGGGGGKGMSSISCSDCCTRHPVEEKPKTKRAKCQSDTYGELRHYTPHSGNVVAMDKARRGR